MGKILLYIGNSDLRASLRIWLERIVEVDCLACFKITEQTLKNLKSEKVPEDEVLEKLTSIKVKDREFTVEKEFVEALTETIGKEQTNRFASSIFKYALSFPTDGDVDLVIADGTGPKERYGLAPFEELRRHFWENEFTRVAEYRKWAKPIIFISTEKIEDLCGEKDGKKLAAALDVDPKIGILDFDIWHHSLKLPASLSDLKDLLYAIIGEDFRTGSLPSMKKRFQALVALEHLDYVVRRYHLGQRKIFGTSGHGQLVEFGFEPKTQVRDKTKKELKKFNTSELGKLRDRDGGIKLLLLDDFAEKSLRPSDSASDQLPTKKQIIEDTLLPDTGPLGDLFDIEYVEFERAKKLNSWVEAGCQKIKELKGKKTAQGEPPYYLILLDYLFTSIGNKDLASNQKQNGVKFIDALNKQKSEAADVDVEWIFFISCFPEIVLSNIYNANLQLFSRYSRIDPGADPVSTPELFLLKLLPFLYWRLTFSIQNSFSELKRLHKRLEHNLFLKEERFQESCDIREKIYGIHEGTIQERCRRCVKDIMVDMESFVRHYENISRERKYLKDILNIEKKMEKDFGWYDDERLTCFRKEIVDHLASALRQFLWAPESDWAMVQHEIDYVNAFRASAGLRHDFNCPYILNELIERSKIY